MSRLLLAALLCLSLSSFAARAEEAPKPDDRVVFDMSSEDWVTTKTAHVAVNVEAAVSGNNAGSMRGDMVKAVNDLAKADWRLTSFNRSQDQTGLERWSATFEARLPENELNGLNDNAKKVSKAGMQLSISDINFSPTLEEMEAARSALRTQVYKTVNDQLAALNTSMPGRNYRIAMINFTSAGEDNAPMPRVVRGQAPMLMAASNAGAPASVERAEKITLTAHVVFAALPEAKADNNKH